MRRRRAPVVSQAWIELLAEDPEALSAFAIARRRLAAARDLVRLERMRLIELSGPLPEVATQEELLRRSTRFYNPHKERCTVRTIGDDPIPVRSGDRLVLVTERGGVRRDAAERWWSHETGKSVEVREGVVWVLRFGPGAPAPERATELATVTSRACGLLCNPHSQDVRHSGNEAPLPWIGD